MKDHQATRTIYNNSSLFMILLALIIGILAGLGSILFRGLVAFFHNLFFSGHLNFIYYETLHTSPSIWGIGVIFVPMIGGLIVIWIIEKFARNERGLSIPEIMYKIHSKEARIQPSIALAKTFASAISIGSGASIGREGPVTQIGATFSSLLCDVLNLSIEKRNILISAGVAASTGAMFNAPLAGVIFAMEELNKNFSPAILMSTVAASLSADFITKLFYGSTSAFNFPLLPILPVNYYIYLIGLGLLIGLFGGFFNRSLLETLKIKEKLGLPNGLVILIPLLIAGIFGYFLPEVLGGGNHLIDSLGQSYFPISMLIILVLAKFFFTLVSYGTGVPGGIFLPILVIGALTGNIYSDLIIKLFHVNPSYANNFIIFAMAAYFTAVVKAPITGSILITEMTGSFSHLWALITVSTVAYLASDFLKTKPIYEALYDRILSRKNSTTNKNQKETMILIETVICLGSEISGKSVKQIVWPKHCLLVNIKRGDQDIIPQGDTRLYPGDHIFALVNENRAVDIEQSLCSLSDEKLMV